MTQFLMILSLVVAAINQLTTTGSLSTLLVADPQGWMQLFSTCNGLSLDDEPYAHYLTLNTRVKFLQWQDEQEELRLAALASSTPTHVLTDGELEDVYQKYLLRYDDAQMVACDREYEEDYSPNQMDTSGYWELEEGVITPSSELRPCWSCCPSDQAEYCQSFELWTAEQWSQWEDEQLEAHQAMEAMWVRECDRILQERKAQAVSVIMDTLSINNTKLNLSDEESLQNLYLCTDDELGNLLTQLARVPKRYSEWCLGIQTRETTKAWFVLIDGGNLGMFYPKSCTWVHPHTRECYTTMWYGKQRGEERNFNTPKLWV